MPWAYRVLPGGGWFVWLGRGEKSSSSGDVEADPIWFSGHVLLGAWAESTGHRRVTLLACAKAYSTSYIEFMEARLVDWPCVRIEDLPSALGLTCIFTVRYGGDFVMASSRVDENLI